MKILFCIAFIISFFSASYACSCTVNATEQGQIEDIKGMEIIFYGKVISVGEKEYVGKKRAIKFERDGELFYQNETVRQTKFKVLRAWKGIDTTEITVGANAWNSCSVNVEVGQKLFVYIDNTNVFNPLNYIYHCSLDLFDKTLLKKVYGEGEIIKSQNLRQDKISEFVLSIIRQFIFLPA